MKQLIEFIVKNSLPPKSEVLVKQIEDDSGITFQIQVPAEFRGKIIGRGGINIKAIRNVLNILARRSNQHVHIKITD